MEKQKASAISLWPARLILADFDGALGLALGPGHGAWAWAWRLDLDLDLDCRIVRSEKSFLFCVDFS